jgi:hypothetical protein
MAAVAKSQLANPVFGLVDRIRSAGRTGRRLHLDPEHVKVLMEEEVYLALTRREAREMQRLSALEETSASSSATSGFGNVPSVSPGTSAGSNAIPPDAVSRGASQFLRAEVARTLRRKKQSTRSLHTT